MTPSVKTLAALSLEHAQTIRKILDGRLDPSTDPQRFPLTCAWIRSCYPHVPEYTDVDRAGVEIRLSAASELIDGFGRESCNGRPKYRSHYWQDCVLVYVNMGDPYTTTLIYDTDSACYRVACWGDYVERDRRLQE